jgi:NAD(P)-dependent dehydrogenase (short-subunit alcohol dehydrogenase family)
MSTDGIEATFALHGVAPFVLSKKLHSILAKSRGRVVNIVTRMPPNPRLDVDDLVNPRSYWAYNRYTTSKVALLMLTLEQAERWRSDGIQALALFPGIHPWTRFGRDTPAITNVVGRLIARISGITSTLEDVRKRYAIACFDNFESGTFLAKGVPAAPPPIVRDPSIRTQLWQLLDKITQ